MERNEEATFFQWLPSIRTAVRLCLLLQVVVAGLLIFRDAWPVVERQGRMSINTVPTPAISPGDQARPFVRVSVPGHMDRRRRTDSPVTLPEDLPLRLDFTEQTSKAYGRILLLTGSIEEGDDSRLAGYLDSMETPPDVIALHSPGGNVGTAQAIGRMVRARELDTLIAPDAACLSSCPYVLAAGVSRTVSKAGWVGLHQHYYDESLVLPAFLAVQGIQQGQGETMDYLHDMGVDPLILTHALKTPPEDIYLLVEQELTDYRLATKVVD